MMNQSLVSPECQIVWRCPKYSYAVTSRVDLINFQNVAHFTSLVRCIESGKFTIVHIVHNNGMSMHRVDDFHIPQWNSDGIFRFLKRQEPLQIPSEEVLAST